MKKIGFNIRTLFGGLLTVLMIVGLTGFLMIRIYTIYQTNEYSYVSREVTYTVEEMHDMNMTLGKFNTSANFFFAFSDFPNDYDVLNNPYFSLKGQQYYYWPDFLRLDEHEFELCSQD